VQEKNRADRSTLVRNNREKFAGMLKRKWLYSPGTPLLAQTNRSLESQKARKKKKKNPRLTHEQKKKNKKEKKNRLCKYRKKGESGPKHTILKLKQSTKHKEKKTKKSNTHIFSLKKTFQKETKGSKVTRLSQQKTQNEITGRGLPRR